MHVLHILRSIDPRLGGPIEGVLRSSEVWLKNGHTREIVTLDAPSSPWLSLNNIQVHPLGIANSFYNKLYNKLYGLIPWLRYNYSPHLVPWLKKHANEYDAIIINGLWHYGAFGAWRVLRRSNVPYFVFPHGMLDPWFNTAYPIKHLIRATYWKIFEHNVLRDARCVFFTTLEEMNRAETSFTPYRCRSHIVGYGTLDVTGDPNSQIKAFQSRHPELIGRRFLLFLSRIDPKKGIDLLIKAFAENAIHFPDVDLVIAGPNQLGLKSKLEKLSAELGIDKRIHWPGMLTGDEKWGAFRAADAFVLPSHQENFGIVIAEAMAVDKPVLVTRQVNIWHEIETQKAGIIVNDNLAEVTRGVTKILSMSEADRKAMGQNARNCFIKHFNLQTIAMELLRIMDQHISPPPD